MVLEDAIRNKVKVAEGARSGRRCFRTSLSSALAQRGAVCTDCKTRGFTVLDDSNRCQTS